MKEGLATYTYLFLHPQVAGRKMTMFRCHGEWSSIRLFSTKVSSTQSPLSWPSFHLQWCMLGQLRWAVLRKAMRNVVNFAHVLNVLVFRFLIYIFNCSSGSCTFLFRLHSLFIYRCKYRLFRFYPCLNIIGNNTSGANSSPHWPVHAYAAVPVQLLFI